MDCIICRNELEAYHLGNLPEDMKTTVEDHLKNCMECSDYYKVLMLSEMVISGEKEIEPSPYLASVIMSAIENSESEAHESKLFRILKPAIMTASLAAAIFAGILIGNVYAPVVKSAPVPIELALMNDGEIELIDVFSTE